MKETIKEKETTTEVVVFNIETFKASQLPQLIGKREAQQKIIDDNPYVVIIDTATHESAKKARTALKTARTSIANEKKMVVDRLKEVVIQSVSKEYDELSQMPAPFEDKQQTEIDRWDDIKKAEKAAKEKAEQDRIDGIKVKIEEFRTTWKTTISEMEFSDIETKTAEFDKAVTEYDKKPLEEFSVLFNRNVSDLELAFIDKTKSLTEAENLRLAKIEQEEAAAKIAKEKEEFEAEKKAAADKLAKDKADQDKITAENARKSKEIADAQAKLDSDKKAAEEAEEKRQADIEAEKNAVNVITEECIPETPSIEYVDPLSKEELVAFENIQKPNQHTVVSEIKEVVVTEHHVTVVLEPTWNSIFEEFKHSPELELSVWLEANYNVPTKK